MQIGSLLTELGTVAVARRGDALVELPGTVEQLIADGEDVLRRAIESATTVHAFDESRLAPLLGPAVPNPGKVLCIGKNYADHAEELGGKPPEKPEVFLRSRTSLAAPCAPVYRPRSSRLMDWEVELAVVIGKPGRYIPASEAMRHIFGYAVFNDFSFRDFQRFGSQWIPGKNFDRSGPLGPFVVTADEVADPFDLELSCVIERDGRQEQMQHSNTSLMVHRIPDLIAYISLWSTLEPGDVIATGTPGGVGDGRNPKRFLTPGETVLTRITGVGELKNQVLEEAAAAS
jgi:acylpyruvate hydrolase